MIYECDKCGKKFIIKEKEPFGYCICEDCFVKIIKSWIPDKEDSHLIPVDASKVDKLIKLVEAEAEKLEKELKEFEKSWLDKILEKIETYKKKIEEKLKTIKNSEKVDECRSSWLDGAWTALAHVSYLIKKQSNYKKSK